jgi:hypothetical protein
VATSPVPAPAADSAALESYIASHHIDVAATSSTFSIGGGAAGSGLTSIDASTAFDATLPWADTSDTFVDLYAYSEPVFLGTFPVTAGVVEVTDVDLSALAAGSHDLVFVGQTSRDVSVVAISLAAAPPTLALTGTDAVAPMTAALAALLLGLSMIVFVRTRARH